MSSTDDSPPRPLRARLWRVGLCLLAVAGLVLVIGNATILVGTFAARVEEPTPTIDVAGIDNFRVVDERVVRGDAPTGLGYRSLASLGVTTVADLRAEHDLGVPESLLEELGIETRGVADPRRSDADRGSGGALRGGLSMLRRASSTSTAVRAWAGPGPWLPRIWSRPDSDQEGAP